MVRIIGMKPWGLAPKSNHAFSGSADCMSYLPPTDLVPPMRPTHDALPPEKVSNRQGHKPMVNSAKHFGGRLEKRLISDMLDRGKQESLKTKRSSKTPWNSNGCGFCWLRMIPTTSG